MKWLGQGIKNYLPPDIPTEQIPDDFLVNGLHPGERKKVVGSLYKTIATGSGSWESDCRFLRTDGT